MTMLPSFCTASVNSASASLTAWLRHLHPAGELLRLGDERGLRLFGRLRDLLAERVLLGAQRLEHGDGGAARGIGRDGLVDERRGLAAQLLRTLDEVGVLAEQHGVDHPSKSSRGIRRRLCSARRDGIPLASWRTIRGNSRRMPRGRARARP